MNAPLDTHRADARGVREPLAVAAVVLAAVGIPMVVAVATGAIHVPHEDDWAFYRIAATLVDSGELRLINWNEMTLIGHLAWGAPFLFVFGTSVSAAHWAGAAAAAASLFAAYALYRRFLEPRLALWGIAVLGVFPVFAMLSTSYMTDLSALAAQLSCIALGVAALDAKKSRRVSLLALALAAGFVGFSIRETAIMAPTAVVAAHAIAARRRGDGYKAVAFGAVALVAACAAFYAWRRGVPDGGSAVRMHGLSLQVVSSPISAYFTVALGALPVLALGAQHVLAALRQTLGRAVAAGALAAGLLKIIGGTGEASGSLLLGNYMSQAPPTGGSQLGGPTQALPELAWWVVVGAALIAGILLAGLLAVRARDAIAIFRRTGLAGFDSRVLMIGFFGALTVALFAFRLALGGNIYDRYLLPVLAVVLLFVLRWVGREAGVRVARVRAAAAVALSALLSLVLVLELRGLERGRWDAGLRLVAAGYAPDEVDAGLDWVGVHYSGVSGDAGPARWSPPDAYYLDEIFNRYRNCAAISASPRHEPWMQPLGVERYSTLFGLRDWQLYLYRNRRAC